MADSAALIREFYECFVRADSDGVLALLTPDVAWHAPDCLPYGGTYHGHDGVLRYAAAAAEWYDFIFVEVEDVAELAPGRAVTVGAFGGRTKVTGVEFRVPFCQTWEFRGDQGAVLRYWNDSGAVLRALGVPPRAA